MAELAVPTSPVPGARRFPARVLIAAAVIAAAAGFLVVTAVQDTAVYYLTVSELQAAALYDQPVRVAGNVVYRIDPARPHHSCRPFRGRR